MKPNAQQINRDKKFREWIQKQPSVLSGQFSEYVNGEGRCIAAHVRRANNSGTGTKPLFSCIPLTKEEHDTQHQYGEAAAIFRFLDISRSPANWRRETISEWFEKRADEYLKRWESSL